MSSSIFLPSVLISNGFAILLLLVLVSGSFWRLRTRNTEDRLLCLILLTILLCCIMDPLTVLLDGHPGRMIRLCLYIGDYWIFAANIICGHCWLTYLCCHLNGYVSSAQKTFTLILSVIGTAFLIVNPFVPILFQMDKNNTYSRGPLFQVFALLFLLYITDSVVVYLTSRRRGGSLKFFPIWVILLPLLTGIIAQLFIYGLSTIWPCMSIAAAGVLASLQNESIFRDPLTGLYSRYYLDDLKAHPRKLNVSRLTIMMLDLNHFKQINDRFGHQTGDDALKETAQLLLKVTGSLGTVIRYAGDEFIILLNTQNQETVNAYIESVHQSFEEFQRTSGCPYQLSAAIGCCAIDLNEHSINETINEIDHRMYENKKQYYGSDSEK